MAGKGLSPTSEEILLLRSSCPWVLLFTSDMRNNSEQGIKSEADVIPAIACFLRLYDLEDFTTKTPEIIQGMFNDLMSTEFGDSREYRERLIFVLMLCQDFGAALAPFTSKQFNVALKAV